MHRHRLLGAEVAGAANQEAGVAVGDFRFAGFDLLAVDLAGEFLGRYLAVAVHQNDQRLGVFVLEDQGFDHGMLVHIQFARRHLGAAMFFVGIEVGREGDLVGLEEFGGLGFGGVFGFAHGVWRWMVSHLSSVA